MQQSLPRAADKHLLGDFASFRYDPPRLARGTALCLGDVGVVTTSNAPRILISRLSALGDCILTLPLACALRDAFPQAWIGWVVESGTAPLLAGHSCIDQLVVVKRGWLSSPWTAWNLRSELLPHNFDIALDPQSLTKSAVAAWLSGAPRRIGFSGPQGRELSSWFNTETIEPRARHVVDRYLELLRPLGVLPPSQPEFRIPAAPDAEATVAEFVRRAHLQQGFVVLNPGAGWRSKQWPREYFGRTARRIGQRFGLPCVVSWAGGEEESWAREIVHHSGGQAILAPSTSLPELASLLRRAKLFVGSDTGPLHLAAAVGTLAIGLYGPTRGEECGPYGAGNLALQAYYQEGTCRERRQADNTAMQAITPDEVEAACEYLLNGSARPPAAAVGQTAARRDIDAPAAA